MTEIASPSSVTRDPTKVSFFNDPKVRSTLFQVLALALVAYVIVSAILNAADNLQKQKIAGGFAFLQNTAGFGISQALIPWAEAMSYGRAFLVGLLNTLLVAAIGIVLATLLGFIVGVARLSRNWVISKIAYWYVEVIRNLPLLFQIVFWYLVIINVAPAPRNAIAIGFKPFFEGIAGFLHWAYLGFLAAPFVSLAAMFGDPSILLHQRGINMPRPMFQSGAEFIGVALAIGLVAAFAIRSWAKKRQAATGRQFPIAWTMLGLILGLPLLAYLATGAPISFDVPTKGRFNVTGGMTIIPEFIALLVALVAYTAAFIGEIVRAGIQAVSHGQTEAGRSLGLQEGRILNLVVIPQALRVIIPPLTSQYLNLTKNSSLAVGIGYPDMVSVGGTILNQTGQAIEIIAMFMVCYLTISILTSLFMNWYNQRIALVER